MQDDDNVCGIVYVALLIIRNFCIDINIFECCKYYINLVLSINIMSVPLKNSNTLLLHNFCSRY